MPQVKREKTPQQALETLMRLCSRAEKCTGDARRLMRGWGVNAQDAERVVARLVAERFIDERRYALAFVRDKVRLNGWGPAKIRAALAAKGVERQAVEHALGQIPDDSLSLEKRLERKLRLLHEPDPYRRKVRLMRYGISLGYDCQTVAEAVCKILNEVYEDEF